jgi:hypothetical protein
MRAGFVVATWMMAGCAAPNVDALVADKHYAEALCAISRTEEGDPTRARVLHALAADTRVTARAEILNPRELAARFGDGAAALDAHGIRAVKFELATNVLPLDTYGIAATLDGSFEPSPTALVALTGEPEPPPVEGDTYATPGNLLRSMGWVFFFPVSVLSPELRQALAFRPARTLMRAPLEDYRRLAPKAMHVFDGLEGKCEPWQPPDDGEERLRAGGTCEAIYLVATDSRSALRLKVLVVYGAAMMRTGEPTRGECAASLETSLDLGASDAIDATVARRFAAGGRARLPRPVRWR